MSAERLVNIGISANNTETAFNNQDNSDINSVIGSYISLASLQSSLIELYLRESNPNLALNLGIASLSVNLSSAMNQATNNGGFDISAIQLSTWLSLGSDIYGIAGGYLTIYSAAAASTGFGTIPASVAFAYSLTLNSLSIALSVAATTQANNEAAVQDLQKQIKETQQALNTATKQAFPNGIPASMLDNPEFWDKWDKALKDFNPSIYNDKWDRILKQPHDKWWDARDYRIRRKDPLVLDLNGDGIQTTNVRNQHILFDYEGTGQSLQATSGINSNDGMLVIDKNNNGTIDNGNELFSNYTELSNGTTAIDGIQALQDKDSNQDSKINNLDTDFNQLKIWQDLNQNGITDAGELKTLTELNITELNVSRTNTYR